MAFGDTHTWYDGQGGSHVLDPASTGVKVGRMGFFMPPIGQSDELVPLQPGSRFRRAIIEPREIDLPILLQAASHADLRTKLRDILGWFDPQLGEGRLQVASPVGDVRSLYCRYVGSGLGISEQIDNGGATWQEFVITLRANDPYWWSDGAPVSITVTPGGAAAFFPMTFPLKLAASEVYGSFFQANTGQVATPLTWTLTGPAASFAFRNLDTGEVIDYVDSVPALSTITVETAIGRQSVTDQAGANKMGSIQGYSAFWHLPPLGANVRVEITGASSATRATLTYRPRYLGA